MSYIKKLLAATKGRTKSNDAIKLFERVEREGGFHLRRLERNWGGASNFNGNKRVIYVNPVTTPANDREKLHSEYAYANTVLNELMHHARKSGIFTDRALARAAFSLLSAEDQRKNPLPETDDEEVNSSYFHPLFKIHCRSITGE